MTVGITNHDKYSLVREGVPLEHDRVNTMSSRKSDSGMGTLTLGRSKEKKMEMLRKQLHTDEDRTCFAI